VTRYSFDASSLNLPKAIAAQELPAIERHVERHAETITSVAGFVYFPGVNKFDLQDDVAGFFEFFELLRHVVAMVIKHQSFQGVIGEPHAFGFPGKVLAVRISDSRFEILVTSHVAIL
jgi:hypothetical protein